MLTATSVEQVQQSPLDQATELVRKAIKGAISEKGVRAQLTAAGFDGSNAMIRSGLYENEGFFIALVIVRSPLGTIKVSMTNTLR